MQGIDKPPPEIVYPKSPTPIAPDLPSERSPEPLPSDEMPAMPSIPRERTPPLKVSQREIVPLPVPTAPKQPSLSPSKPLLPPSILSIPSPNESFIKPVAKIRSKPSMPPSISPVSELDDYYIPSPQPSEPQKPQIPLPRPKTPKTAPKTYNLGMMPSAVSISNDIMSPSLPAPAAPTHRHHKAPPSLPEVSKPKPQRFSSAMQPKQPTSTLFPSSQPPQQPSMPSIPFIPSTPPKMEMRPKINAIAAMPPEMAMPAPRSPSFKSLDLPQPHLPPPASPKLPESKMHNLGVMPATVDEKPIEFPSLPPSVPTDSNIIHPSLPQEPEPEPKPTASIKAIAIPPPKPIEKPLSPPPMPQNPPISESVPSPHEQKEPEMQALKSGVTSHNEKPKKPKKKVAKKTKKSKKVKKDKDTIEEQKQHLTVFFMTYSVAKNWEEGAKENGVQRYVLKFANREPLNARMAFLYSMTLYLGQIVGVNKRCISHAFMLFKSVRAQIDTLSEEFALILQTLEHHNDDKLWKYVYSFLYNAAAYFKHIQRFVGTRTSVANPKQYSKHLKSQSRDYTIMTTNRRESSYRKLSGLSENSGQSLDFGASIGATTTSNLSGYGKSGRLGDKMIHTSLGPPNNLVDSSSSSGSGKKNKNKKKKKASGK